MSCKQQERERGRDGRSWERTRGDALPANEIEESRERKGEREEGAVFARARAAKNKRGGQSTSSARRSWTRARAAASAAALAAGVSSLSSA